MDLRLWATAALNMAIAVAEILGGVFSGSLALLSDATHNLGDLVAVLLALFARRLSRRPPTTRHTYGLKRVEVMAALINASLLIGATVFIAREAVLRILHPAPVARGIMLVVALVALGANAAAVLLLRHHDHEDVNVRSAFLHMAQDAFASVAVVIAALLAHTVAGAYVDSIAALVVSLVVMRSALSLIWQTTSTILECVPRDVDIAELAERVGLTFAPACTMCTSGRSGPSSGCSPRTSRSDKKWMGVRSKPSWRASRCSCTTNGKSTTRPSNLRSRVVRTRIS